MATAAGGFSAVFRTMARLRQAPAVHPRAVTFAARLIVSHQTPLIAQGNYLATVKLSKGAGMPGRWPDVLGLGLRFRLLSTDDPFDFLFSSAGDGQWTRWLPVPAADWNGARYGTLAPYESAGRWWWLMLTPSDPPVGHASIHELEHSTPPSFTLHISGETAAWHQVGRLDLDERLGNTGLVLDPVLNHPHGAVPAPSWLRDLRERAYSGSRQGRDAPPPDQTYRRRTIMKIDKSQIVDLLKNRGDHDKADHARSDLPDQVDTDQHADKLYQLGIDPTHLLGGGDIGDKLGL